MINATPAVGILNTFCCLLGNQYNGRQSEEAPGKTSLFRPWIPRRASERQEVGTGLFECRQLLFSLQSSGRLRQSSHIDVLGLEDI